MNLSHGGRAPFSAEQIVFAFAIFFFFSLSFCVSVSDSFPLG